MSATARERAVVALDEALMELHARRDRRREQLEALWQADLRAEREVRRLLQRVLHYLSASGGSPLPPAPGLFWPGASWPWRTGRLDWRG